MFSDMAIAQLSHLNCYETWTEKHISHIKIKDSIPIYGFYEQYNIHTNIFFNSTIV